MREGIDWNQVWMERQRESRDSGRGLECWQAWSENDEARSYLSTSRNQPGTQGRIADLSSLVEPHWRVLDIGAGPGNLALPLSEKVMHVTAVEPAPGMVQVLQEEIGVQGVDNIDVVHKRWDDIDPGADLFPPYQLSLASFSLGMLDLRASLEKMMAVTTKKVVLYWHAGHQAWDRHSLVLWPLLHGREFTPIPKSDVVFNLLYSMGIYPDIRVIRNTTEMIFPSLDEAVEFFARRYEAGDQEKKSLLKKYLQEKLVVRNGEWRLPRFNVGMRISWNMEDSDES